MKNVVLEKYEEIDYVLIARVKDNGEVHEYVAAWHYNESDKTWGQGHYFSDLSSAVDYINQKYDEWIERQEEEINFWASLDLASDYCDFMNIF